MSHPALSILAQIARTDPAALAPDWPLSRLGLHSSLGLSVLRSALERKFQRPFAPFTWQTTVAEVVAATESAGPAPAGANGPAVPLAVPAAAPPAPRAAFGPFGGRRHTAPPLPPLGHGIDLQEVSSLPVWGSGPDADAFYQSHLSAAEREGVKERPDAQAHLCGLWCAKEAVRKSDRELMGLAFSEISIETEASGAPRVRLLRPGWDERFAITLSISHSAAYAVGSAITQRR